MTAARLGCRLTTREFYWIPKCPSGEAYTDGTLLIERGSIVDVLCTMQKRLKAWRERFMARREEAVRLYDE